MSEKRRNRYSAKARKVLALAMLAIAVVAAYWLGAAIKKPESSALVVSPEDLALGEVWETKDYRKTLRITNQGREDADILDFVTSCSCVQVEPRSLVIPAGAQREVCLKIDLTLRCRLDLGQAERAFEAGIAAVTRPKTASATRNDLSRWVIQGKIKSRVTFDPMQTEFWGCVRGRKRAPVLVTAKVHVPFARFEVLADPALATVRVLREAEDRNTFRLEVSPSDRLPAGAFHFEVPAKIETTEGKSVDGSVLSVAGEMQEVVVPTPKTIWFGSACLGTRVTGWVTLSPLDGDYTPEITGHEVSGEGLTVEPLAVEIKGGRAFKLEQEIRSEGQQCATVKFAVREQHGQSTLTIPVECHYYGLRIEKRD
jgi:hypothetical protein